MLATPAISRLLKWVAQVLPDDGGEAGFDLVFVTPPEAGKGWILDAICREIGSRLSELRIDYRRLGTPLPRAKCYFFSHYMYYVGAMSRLRPRKGRSFVFATHLEPAKHQVPDALLAGILRNCDGVICMNTMLRDTLAGLGLKPEQLHVVNGAADAGHYQAHERVPHGKVGFCSAYYARKSPNSILEIVRMLPQRRFILLGKGWQNYPRFQELSSLPNFEYVETSYANYAQHYAEMSVFVSASQLEGGPIPLIEAMMSNAVPVASRTGFAPDMIRHGDNGFLFDVGAPTAVVCELIERAFAVQTNVSETVRHCDWMHFTARIASHMELAPRAGSSPAIRVSRTVS